MNDASATRLYEAHSQALRDITTPLPIHVFAAISQHATQVALSGFITRAN
jgi:hypothetical protein